MPRTCPQDEFKDHVKKKFTGGFSTIVVENLNNEQKNSGHGEGLAAVSPTSSFLVHRLEEEGAPHAPQVQGNQEDACSDGAPLDEAAKVDLQG